MNYTVDIKKATTKYGILWLERSVDDLGSGVCTGSTAEIIEFKFVLLKIPLSQRIL